MKVRYTKDALRMNGAAADIAAKWWARQNLELLNGDLYKGGVLCKGDTIKILGQVYLKSSVVAWLILPDKYRKDSPTYTWNPQRPRR